MPADFELDESRRIVFSRAWGDLTDAELLDHMARMKDAHERGQIDSRWAQVADFSAVRSMNGVSSSGVRALADGNPWHEESIRVLVVPEDVQYGLARMYQMLGEPKTNRVVLVRSVAEAIARVEDRSAAQGNLT